MNPFEGREFPLLVHDYNVPLNPWSTLTPVLQKRLPEISGGAVPYLDNLFVFEKDQTFWGPDEKQFSDAANFFSAKMKADPEFLPGVAQAFEDSFKEAKVFVAECLATDFSSKTNQELYEILRRGNGIYTEHWAQGMIGQFFEMGDVKLSENLKERLLPALTSHGDAEAVFAKLMTPREPSGIAEEYRAVLETIKELQSDPARRDAYAKTFEELPAEEAKRMNDLAERYGWFQYYYAGPAATGKYYFELVKRKLSSVDAAAELTERKEALKELVTYQEKIEQELPEEDRKLVSELRTFAYYKEARKESQYHINFGLDGWYREAAQRLSSEPLYAKYVLESEYEAMFVNGAPLLTPEELQKRYRACAYYCLDGKDVLVSGDEALEYKKLYRTSGQAAHTEGVLKGSVAYPGFVRGRAITVNSAADMEKFADGDILISVATNPVLVPAMNRAAAIVTNTGGVTCHAAIVSRELKIPCVVGTKVATDVLRDGDVVEVDANKGIVRKI